MHGTNKRYGLPEFRNYEEVMGAVKKLDKDPGTADALFNKGAALQELGNYAEAIRYFTRALEIDPADAFTWTYSGLALKGLGKYEEAIGCYDNALEIDPNWGRCGPIKGLP